MTTKSKPAAILSDDIFRNSLIMQAEEEATRIANEFVPHHIIKAIR